MRDGIIDNYQFRSEEEKFVFENYAHYLIVFLLIPFLTGIGLVSGAFHICLPLAGLFALTLFFKHQITFDFRLCVIVRQWLFLNRKIGSSKIILITSDIQLEIKEGGDAETVDFSINALDKASNKFIPLLSFSTLEMAEKWREAILTRVAGEELIKKMKMEEQDQNTMLH